MWKNINPKQEWEWNWEKKEESKRNERECVCTDENCTDKLISSSIPPPVRIMWNKNFKLWAVPTSGIRRWDRGTRNQKEVTALWTRAWNCCTSLVFICLMSLCPEYSEMKVDKSKIVPSSLIGNDLAGDSEREPS